MMANQNPLSLRQRREIDKNGCLVNNCIADELLSLLSFRLRINNRLAFKKPNIK